MVLPYCAAQFRISGPSDGNRKAQGLTYDNQKGISYDDQKGKSRDSATKFFFLH